MGLKITKKPATATITTEHKDKGEVIAEETQEEKVEMGHTLQAQAKPWCEVGFEASYTHNLGNYKSTRVAVTLKVPCMHEEVDNVFDYAKTWVEEKLNPIVEELVSSTD